MNNEEGMSLAKMAVVALLVVLVISAVVGICYMAYSWFTSGTDKLGDQVNSIDSSAYSQFDDRQCTGTDVLTALKSYRDSDIAILIGNGADGIDGVKMSDYNSITGNTLTVKNYCALAAQLGDSNTATNNDTKNTVIVKLSDGRWYLTKDSKESAGVSFQENGSAKRNTNFSPTQSKDTKNKDSYVSQKANFYSKLVYSSEDEICGIMFLKMNNTKTTN